MSAPAAITEPWAGVVEAPENRLAFAAVTRLARSLLRESASPFPHLLIHGPVGTGKSLLASALVRRVARGSSTVQSVPARELRYDGGHEFKDLAVADLAVIEDIHYLPASATNTLSRLLDERQRRRKATLLTANAGPARLRKLPRSLASRLAGGLVIGIEPFSAASRKLVLDHHLHAIHLRLEPAALNWLAARPTGGGLRPLLGLLDTLKAQHRGHATPLPLDAVKRIADDETPLGVDTIVKRVAEAFGVNTKELLGPSRLRNVLLPRQVAMYLARDLALLTLPRIGQHFGGRDHTTVSHAVNKIRTAMADDRQLAGTIRQIRLELA